VTGFGAVPGSRRLTVAADAGRAARRVRALAGASDWRRELLDRIGTGLVALVGTRPLRPTDPWPWPTRTPAAVLDGLGLPGLVLLAAAAPRQPERHRLSLLASAGSEFLVVKLGERGDGIETEAAALALLTADPLPGIATPRVVAAGHLSNDPAVAFVATTALGVERQRPAVDEPLPNFERDLAPRLAGLPRPPGAVHDVVPVHGDLAPWNLRRTSRGLALFDWEAAGWGPPGSDLDHYRAACATLRHRRRRAAVRA
jgi:hypothetical protein